MKSIEERATSHAGVSTTPRAIYNENYVLATRYASYKEGATEQKELDEKEFEKKILLIQQEQYKADKESFFYATYEWMKGRYSEDELKEFVKFANDYEKYLEE